MINLQLFYSSTNLINNLKHHFAGVENIIIVTPSPIHADIARTKLAKVHDSIETVTIAKFLRDELKSLLPEEELANFQGKSELNLLLGSLWKMGRKDSSYELFKRSFQMLTDFRSFTLNEDVLKTVLEEYDEQLGGAVFWFHKLLGQMDIIDEHRSYFLLAERIRMGDLPPLYPENRTIVFWGFDFLTGSQVDLLNAFSIRNDIFIPFSAEAYEKSIDLDWIKWLSKFDANIEICDEKSESKKIIKVFEFPKNYLSKSLRAVGSHEKLSGKSIDYILGTKNLKDEFVSEIPFGDVSYKIGIDLFHEKAQFVFDTLVENFKDSENTHHEDIIAFLKNFASEKILKRDFRLLKVISIFIQTVLKWTELSENNESLGLFDFKIIFDSTLLDLPRNSLVNKGSPQAFSLRDLKTIDKESQADISLLCITGEYGSVKGSVVQYSESVEKYLATIGPVRRGELEFLSLKAKIQEQITKDNLYILVENNLLGRDLGWRSIIPEDQVEVYQIPVQETSNKEYIFDLKRTDHKLSSLSATKIQTYLDCPKKYYFNYALKLRPLIELPSALNFMQLGQIEHRVIEDYLKQNQIFDDVKHTSIINTVLDEYENNSLFKKEYRKEYFLEVKALTTNIISELVILNSELGLKIRCEVSLPSTEEYKISGSIDCFGENESTLLILDFKRGGGSIPSQVGLKEFRKIQLWFYLERMKRNNLFNPEKKLIWGYINLSKLEESLIYSNDENIIDRLKSLDLKAFSNLNFFNEEFNELCNEYSKFEDELVDKLSHDKDFLLNPIEPKICSYCNMNNICPKSEVNRGQC